MIYIIVFFLAVIVFYYVIRGGKVKIHKKIPLSMIKKYIEILYFRGFNQSGIVINVLNKIECVQFGKFLNEKENIIIHFIYPLVEWSKSFIEPLKELLLTKKYKYKIEDAGYGSNLQNLIVEFTEDIESVIFFTRLIFKDLYGLKDNGLVELYFTNVSPRVEIIGKTEIEPSEVFYKGPSIALSNAEHWGLVIGRFIGSLTRLVFPPKNK